MTTGTVFYTAVFTIECVKTENHLAPKCTKVFLLLAYDTSVNHIHLFIALKPVIHPHPKIWKETDPFGAHKNCDLKAPATAGVSGTGSFRRKSNFKLTSFTLNG